MKTFIHGKTSTKDIHTSLSFGHWKKDHVKERMRERTYQKGSLHFIQFDYIADFWCLLNDALGYYDEN